ALHSFLKSANFLVRKIGSTVRTVTRAPTAFARDKPCATPLWASFEPSVGIRICRYMRVLPTREAHPTTPRRVPDYACDSTPLLNCDLSSLDLTSVCKITV